jgi:hypothetical protein
LIRQFFDRSSHFVDLGVCCLLVIKDAHLLAVALLDRILRQAQHVECSQFKKIFQIFLFWT